MYWVGQKVCSGFPDDLTEKNPSELLGQLNMRSCDGGENVLGYFIAKLTRAEAFETKREKKKGLLHEFLYSFRRSQEFI